MSEKNYRYLSDKEAIDNGLSLNKKQANKNKARYYITDELYNEIVSERIKPNKRKFVETIKKLNKDGEIITVTEKLQSEPIDVPENFEVIKISTSKTTGQQWIQYAPKQETITEDLGYDFINEIVKKHIKKVDFDYVKKHGANNTFDRVIYTDVHIGMTPNKDGFALYDLKWNEEEIKNRLQLLTNYIMKEQQSDVLYLDELGDFLDGWDAQTTRKGHSLPQNMDNQKAFDIAVNFKVQLLDYLINFYSEITLNNICEDNHAGSFGYVVNSAVKQILELKYKNVKVNNMRKFINHYNVGKHCFILSHGKDSKNLKFGFKPVLDSKQAEKIDQYCKHNNIYKQSEFIEFSKGDSHQMLFDYSTSDDFDYCNYPAFSPSSEWVQTNFKKGRSGFVFTTVDYDKNDKTIKPYWFK